MDNDLKYNLRGVSAAKEDVHSAIKNLDKGLFPNAFSKVYPDILDNDPKQCLLMSSDGSGTKSILAYLYAKETGDTSCWRGIAQDALVMNLDDLICTGAKGPFIYSSILNRNKNLIDGQVIKEIIEGNRLFIEMLNEQGIPVVYAGGETADVGDLVRTITVDGSMMTKMQRSDVIQNKIIPGDVIIGFASFGKSTYEDNYNSGIGSNGLTSARHDVLSKYYARNFKESFDPETPEAVIYEGKSRLTDKLAGSEMTVGQALLSPTRTYAPLLRKVFDKYAPKINAVIHCTGGGQIKVLHFMENLRVVKDDLFEMPPVFSKIQHSSGAEMKEMFQVFNMGHRLEVYTSKELATDIIEISRSFNIEAKIVGRVESSSTAEVVIRTKDDVFTYS